MPFLVKLPAKDVKISSEHVDHSISGRLTGKDVLA